MSVSISTERNVKSVVQLPLCEMNVTCFEQCSFCRQPVSMGEMLENVTGNGGSS